MPNEPKYHLRCSVKVPLRYADAEDDNNTSDNKSREKRRRVSPLKRQFIKPAVAVKSGNESNSSMLVMSGPKTFAKFPMELSVASNSRESSIAGIERRFSRPCREQATLPETLRTNLRYLKNVLKLPKARRWVYCEFFYSGVDQQLFLEDNEFTMLLRELFPNLRTKKLCRPEWRAVRRLIGKPRRCSDAFLSEERIAVEQKRAKIRQIYDGTYITLPPNANELPLQLPRPLAVGAKIYARVRSPRDGIYAGTVDAVLPDSYRVVFDKEEMIPPLIIKDFEIMSAHPVEVLSLSYFIEQNRAAVPSPLMKFGLPSIGLVSPVTSFNSYGSARSMVTDTTKRPTKLRDEKVGNFPVRMLVILVKLQKLLEVKRTYVKLMVDLNMEAEKMHLLTDSFPFEFQERYAQVVIDLETVNKQLRSYLNAVHEYSVQLSPQLNDASLSCRPEAVRKFAHTHAVQIVKHCNNGLNVQSKPALDLITSLTALLLQIRSFGRQTCTALDLHSLSDSLNDIRKQIDPSNAAAFQDFVEVHMKEMHRLMLNTGLIQFTPRIT